jgi:hypothetical protein
LRCSVSTAAGRREALRKAQHVADLGRAEGIDRLRVVAHHRDAAPVGLQRVQDAGLQPVGVLEFVDQHVVEAGAHRTRHRRFLQGQVPVQQQVVVVQHTLRLLGLGVGAEQPVQVGLPFGAPRVVGGQHLGQRLCAVERARQDGHAGARQREAALAVVQVEPGAHLGQQFLGVAAVDDAEVRRQAELGRMVAQQPGGHAVEGARPGQLGRRQAAAQAQRLVQQPAGAAFQFGRRTARERHQQDAARVGAVQHQPRHAGGQHHRLARPGTGHHQQRCVAVQHGGLLLGVQQLRDLPAGGAETTALARTSRPILYRHPEALRCPPGAGDTCRMWMQTLGAARDLHRVQQIAGVLVRHGLGDTGAPAGPGRCAGQGRPCAARRARRFAWPACRRRCRCAWRWRNWAPRS